MIGCCILRGFFLPTPDWSFPGKEPFQLQPSLMPSLPVEGPFCPHRILYDIWISIRIQILLLDPFGPNSRTPSSNQICYYNGARIYCITSSGIGPSTGYNVPCTYSMREDSLFIFNMFGCHYVVFITYNLVICHEGRTQNFQKHYISF